MTEITQADRDAAAQVLGEMVLGNEDRAAQVIARHREQAAAEDRAKIVEYLRYYGMLRNIAAKIEAKEHLK